MPGEFFFMGLGGLGVSLAGFAGLIATLDRRPEAHSPIAAWRIRNIVTSGLILTVAGFGIVAVYTATGESLDTTVRVISLFLIVVKAIQLPREGRRGPEWPSEINRRFTVGSSLMVMLLLLLNVWLARVGFLQILFVVLLIDPISIFNPYRHGCFFVSRFVEKGCCKRSNHSPSMRLIARITAVPRSG